METMAVPTEAQIFGEKYAKTNNRDEFDGYIRTIRLRSSFQLHRENLTYSICDTNIDWLKG